MRRVSFELSPEEIELSNILTQITGVMPTDVIDLDEAVAYVVAKKDIGRAIGQKGKMVEALRKRLNKSVYIFADADNLEDFIKSLFNNVKILDIDITNIMGDKVVTLLVSEKDKAKALGKKKAHLRIAKELLKEKFNASLNLKMKVMAY